MHSRVALNTRSVLFEEEGKRSNAILARVEGAMRLRSLYMEHLSAHAALMMDSDRDKIEQGTRLIANFMLLAKDDDAWRDVMNLNIFPRVVELFVEYEDRVIVENCAMIIGELEYWKTLPFNPTMGESVATKCIKCFSQKSQSLNEAVLLLIRNVCADYPQIAHMLLDQLVFIEMNDLLKFDTDNIEQFFAYMAQAGFSIINSRFDPSHLLQVTTFVKQLLHYSFVETIEVGLRAIQALGRNGLAFPFELEDVRRFEDFAASRSPAVVVEALRTLRGVRDAMFMEYVLTRDFLNNLSIMMWKRGRNGMLTGYILKFMKYIIPWRRPKAEDLVVVITCIKISKGRYTDVYYGLKFLLACCEGNDQFVLDIGESGGGICSLIAAPFTQLGQDKIGRIACDLLLMLGEACEKVGADMAGAPGCEMVGEALQEIERDDLSRELTVKLEQVERYFVSRQ